MDATLNDLVGKVQEQTGTVNSMKAFIAGLEQQIKDALSGERLSPEAQTKVNQIFSQLTQNTQEVADAIDSDPNTPPAQPGGEPSPSGQPTTGTTEPGDLTGERNRAGGR